MGLLLVLGDFDHAKYLDASSITNNRQFGTYNYLPPEYYNKKDYKNAAFDIW